MTLKRTTILDDSLARQFNAEYRAEQEAAALEQKREALLIGNNNKQVDIDKIVDAEIQLERAGNSINEQKIISDILLNEGMPLKPLIKYPAGQIPLDDLHDKIVIMEKPALNQDALQQIQGEVEKTLTDEEEQEAYESFHDEGQDLQKTMAKTPAAPDNAEADDTLQEKASDKPTWQIWISEHRFQILTIIALVVILYFYIKK